MRIALLADIHANLEALEAVHHDLKTKEVDTIICLGDLIGYGPNPDEVVNFCRKHNFISVLGNHEAALEHKRMFTWMNFLAQENNLWTGRTLSRENRDYCAQLPENHRLEEALFVHGFPPDSVLRYMSRVSEKGLWKFFASDEAPICFVGHTHDLLMVRWDGSRVETLTLHPGHYTLEEKKYMVSCGSVGQPRDGSNTAKYVVYDSTSRTLDILSVPYDIAKTVKKIENLGFPEAYGKRLW